MSHPIYIYYLHKGLSYIYSCTFQFILYTAARVFFKQNPMCHSSIYDPSHIFPLCLKWNPGPSPRTQGSWAVKPPGQLSPMLLNFHSSWLPFGSSNNYFLPLFCQTRWFLPPISSWLLLTLQISTQMLPQKKNVQDQNSKRTGTTFSFPPYSLTSL